jgi:type IV secretory pathway component VirB8
MTIFSTIFRYREKRTPDKLGLYPEAFHIPAFPERRYLWTSRLLVIFAVLSFCFNIVLCLSLYLLIPLKSSKPVFYRTHNISFALEKVAPNYLNIPYRDVLSEKYLRDYVEMRHGIPRSTADLFYRWDKTSLFYQYSSFSVYSYFINQLNDAQVKEFIRLRMRRKIDVTEVKKLSRDLWQIRFQTVTTTKYQQTPVIINWNAYARVAYQEFDHYEDLEKDEEDKRDYTLNPFGFKITNYSVAYAGTNEAAKDSFAVAKKVFDVLENVNK